MGDSDCSCGCGLEWGCMTSSEVLLTFRELSKPQAYSHSWLKLGHLYLKTKWLKNECEKAGCRRIKDVQRDETHIHIPERENGSPGDRAVNTDSGYHLALWAHWRQSLARDGAGGRKVMLFNNLEGRAMPEPEGRMAASEGTEKLRAIKKHLNTKVFIFKSEWNSVSVTMLERWGGNLVTWSRQVMTVGNQLRAGIGRCLNVNWIHTLTKKHEWMSRQ